jgi:uncharacterized cupin superfamily protein
VDGEAIDLDPGDSTCSKRGTIHGFANHGDETATFLAIVSPAAFGSAYFREIADVLAAAGGGPPDKDAIVAVMRRHGLTPAPPPA